MVKQEQLQLGVVVESSLAGARVGSGFDSFSGSSGVEASSSGVDSSSGVASRKHKGKKGSSFNAASAFEQVFWPDLLKNRVPQPHGRPLAMKRFVAAIGSDEDLARLMAALGVYRKSKRVGEGYVQDASTWMGRWGDWVAEGAVTPPEQVAIEKAPILTEADGKALHAKQKANFRLAVAAAEKADLDERRSNYYRLKPQVEEFLEECGVPEDDVLRLNDGMLSWQLWQERTKVYEAEGK